MKVSRKKPPITFLNDGNVEMEEGLGLTYREYREWMISAYFNGHFDSIKTLEFVIENASNLLNETGDDHRLQRIFTKQIHLAKTELEKLHRKTPEILKNTESMRKKFESLK